MLRLMAKDQQNVAGDTSAHRQTQSADPEQSLGASHDPVELEADRVAALVDAEPAHIEVKAIAPTGQRLAGQSKGRYSATPASALPAIVREVLRSPGQPLDAATRGYFEPRFKYGLSHVRVHTAGQAADSARAVAARAYTVGNDVVFASGQFAPNTSAGRTLLAHELTHVVQQGGGPLALQRSPDPNLDYETVRRAAWADAAKRNDLWQWMKVADSDEVYVRRFMSEKLVKNLRARVEHVKTKGYFFRDLKQWRDRFHAVNDALLESAQMLMSGGLEAEFKKVTGGFHIFEHESTPRVAERLRQLTARGPGIELDAREAADAEYQYEVAAEKLERESMEEGAAIIAEIDEWWSAYDRPMSKSAYLSLAARVDRWGDGVDRLIDMEMAAQYRFTGSGPASRAESPP